MLLKNLKYFIPSIPVFIIAWLSLRPPLPTEWQQIEHGIQRQEIMNIFPNLETENFQEKGFDRITIDCDFPYYPNSYWQLHLSYTDNKVSEIYYLYVNRNIGIFNTKYSVPLD